MNSFYKVLLVTEKDKQLRDNYFCYYPKLQEKIFPIMFDRELWISKDEFIVKDEYSGFKTVKPTLDEIKLYRLYEKLNQI